MRRVSKLSCAGFRFGATRAGIKASGAPDIGVIVADEPTAAAAVFTSNQFKAAPVLVSRAALRKSAGRLRAVVVNSGNANACTGAAGVRDARAMAARAADALGVPHEQIAVASTGVIGDPLPMDRVLPGIDAALGAGSRGGFTEFAGAILTTDRGVKTAHTRATLGATKATLLGCTKGAGMIAPNLATTLTFVTTDARVPADRLQEILQRAADRTFNAISVDGDTSTNDMILVMASGRAGNRGALSGFEDGLTELLDDLSRQLMGGGEGVHHVVTVRVVGARHDRAARAVARTVANSPLVKTAIAGGDPNWGRFLMAVGNAGVPLAASRVALRFDDVTMVEGGVACEGGAALDARVAAVMSRPSYTVTIDLGQGRADAHYLSCDLSHEYVTINADYRT
jgi:glutamate N-acetyltransferase/amino-acid N-acetyltransferase